MFKPNIIALGGGTSAILAIAFLLTGSPLMLILANLAPLPLFLVGLGYGVVAATIAVGVGLVVTGIFGTGAVSAFGLVHALPTWVVIRQSLVNRTFPDGSKVWSSLGSVLCWLTALTGLLLTVAAVASSWDGSGLRETFTVIIGQFLDSLPMDIPEADKTVIVNSLVPFLPAMFYIPWLLVLGGNGLLAQAILVRSGNNIRPTPRLKDFILPDWISWLLVGSAALALLGSGDAAYLGRNLVVIMAVPFFVLGLVVVHTASKRASAAKFLLVVFYVVLFLLAWALPAVAVLGLIEQWVGIRSRLAPPNPPQEDE